MIRITKFKEDFMKDKQIIYGIIIGSIISSIITGVLMFQYFSNNYVYLNKVDIGYFIFKDNHVYQLEQLVDESKFSPDFKKATK
jgi:hypothetical protein